MEKKNQCQHSIIIGPQMGEENVGRCIKCGYMDNEERERILNSKEYKEECAREEKRKEEQEKIDCIEFRNEIMKIVSILVIIFLISYWIFYWI